MRTTIGRDSSSSAPSTSEHDAERVTFDEDAHAHGGPHFTLVVWPNGKTVLATPDSLSNEMFQRIQELLNTWIRQGHSRPLVIGQCKVVMSPVGISEIEVEDGSG